jgi:hypothetical protein
VYPIGRLSPNQRLRVEDKGLGNQGGEARSLEKWLTESTWQPNVVQQQQRRGGIDWQRQGQPVSYLIKPILFGEATRGDANTRNSSLRYLDQSWRLVGSNQASNREEVILVGRPVGRDGSAETITQDGISPTRLWLNNLPGKGAARPGLSGTLSQETYVRVFIPVGSAK